MAFHPLASDMDHLDGFNGLLNEFAVSNFWDSGARREKPDFNNNGGYKEEDWDRYAKVLAGNESGTKTLFAQAGHGSSTLTRMTRRMAQVTRYTYWRQTRRLWMRQIHHRISTMRRM